MELDKKTIKHLIWIVFAGVAFNWALQHLSDLSNAVGWMVSLVTPFLLGGAIAFIINVPMRKIEKHLFPNASRPRVKKLRRPLALVLSIVLNVATFFVSLSDMTPVVWISIIVFVVLLAIYTSIRGKQLEAKKVI